MIIYSPELENRIKLYKKWQDIVGIDTHSLETGIAYPQWVQNELGADPIM